MENQIKIPSQIKPGSQRNSLKELLPWYLAVPFGLMIFFAPHQDWHGDLDAFRNFSGSLWHPYWARWIFQALNILSEQTTFILLSLDSIAMLYFAIRSTAWLLAVWLLPGERSSAIGLF